MARSTGSRKAATIQPDWAAASEARVEQARAGDGGGEKEAQVLREEEGRERGHHRAEGEEGQEGQEEPAEAEAHEVIAEFLVVEELQGQPEHDREDRGGDEDPDPREEEGPGGVALLAPARPVARSPEDGEQQPGKGVLHIASSISCRPLPPVSFRKTGVSFSSSPPASVRRSATVPRARILPPRMMLIWSHISSATSRVWVLMRMATPLRLMARNTCLMRRAPRGSRPTIGSSTRTARGRWRKAAHMTSRCFMPWEKLSTSSSFQPTSSKRASSSRSPSGRPSPSIPQKP